MDFEAKELKRCKFFSIDSEMVKVLATPDGRLYVRYLIEENALLGRINNGNGFRGRTANRQKRLKRLQEELLPRQYVKVFQLLRNL